MTTIFYNNHKKNIILLLFVCRLLFSSHRKYTNLAAVQCFTVTVVVVGVYKWKQMMCAAHHWFCLRTHFPRFATQGIRKSWAGKVNLNETDEGCTSSFWWFDDVIKSEYKPARLWMATVSVFLFFGLHIVCPHQCPKLVNARRQDVTHHQRSAEK
jgi:hypothetical protein